MTGGLMPSDVETFEAHATDAELDDLRARLAAARLPEAETVHRGARGRRRWEQGVPLADLVDVVDELADPPAAHAPAFHVVVPSLPGFGYSDKPAAPGWGIGRVAAAWVE